MREYYYQITYQRFKHSPFEQAVIKAKSVASAKISAYIDLSAYNVHYVIKINKPQGRRK